MRWDHFRTFGRLYKQNSLLPQRALNIKTWFVSIPCERLLIVSNFFLFSVNPCGSDNVRCFHVAATAAEEWEHGCCCHVYTFLHDLILVSRKWYDVYVQQTYASLLIFAEMEIVIKSNQIEKNHTRSLSLCALTHTHTHPCIHTEFVWIFLLIETESEFKV